jgi:hypothetical protein
MSFKSRAVVTSDRMEEEKFDLKKLWRRYAQQIIKTSIILKVTSYSHYEKETNKLTKFCVSRPIGH